eukprot:6187136-Pleurochrysis_carterae.AAC.6
MPMRQMSSAMGGTGMEIHSRHKQMGTHIACILVSNYVPSLHSVACGYCTGTVLTCAGAARLATRAQCMHDVV